MTTATCRHCFQPFRYEPKRPAPRRFCPDCRAELSGRRVLLVGEAVVTDRRQRNNVRAALARWKPVG